MIKISGFVLVQKTNAGIPNLVVAAYDSEHQADQLLKEHFNAETGFGPALIK